MIIHMVVVNDNIMKIIEVEVDLIRGNEVIYSIELIELI